MLASTLGAPASAAFGFLGRIAQAAQPLLSPPAISVGNATAMMTPDRVRAALLEMGMAAGELDIALASALVQAGLPLTSASLAEAYGDLARAPGASPQAYTLAKMLSLPTSPDALRALTTVLNAPGQTPSHDIPEAVRTWLGIGVEAGTQTEAQARHLQELALQIGRSTENRLLSAMQEGEQKLPVADLRTSLLRLALSSGDRALRAEADGMASLVEGQQLLNQAGLAAHTGHPETPLYFAVPLTFDGAPTLAEMRLRLPASRPEGESEEETVLRVTVRVSPPRLGRLQADLTGRLSGSLNCRLGAEKASSARLLVRHTGLLAQALSEAGWTTCDVSCRPQSEWPPLWTGGEAFTTPRTSVDRHV